MTLQEMGKRGLLNVLDTSSTYPSELIHRQIDAYNKALAEKASREVLATPEWVMQNFPDILGRLEMVKEVGGRLVHGGICSNAVVWSTIVGDLARYWRKYSGVHNFPVPAPAEFEFVPSAVGKTVHEQAYEASSNIWDSNTQYGKDRLELLDFLIARLTAVRSSMEPTHE